DGGDSKTYSQISNLSDPIDDGPINKALRATGVFPFDFTANVTLPQTSAGWHYGADGLCADVTAQFVLPAFPNVSAVAAEAALGTSSLCFDGSGRVTLTQTRQGAPQTTKTPFLASDTAYRFEVTVDGAVTPSLWDGSTLHLSSATRPLEILPLTARIQL